MKTKLILTISVIALLSIGMIYMFNPSPIMKFVLVFALIVAAGVSWFAWSLCKLKGRQDEIFLEAWRKGLQRNDLVRVNGVVFVFDSVTNGMAYVKNHNDELYVLMSDVWPVED